MEVVVSKSKLSGAAQIPGSKSHTLRAVLISSLADGDSVISNPLHSKDAYSALGAAAALGAQYDITAADGKWRVKGTYGSPRQPENIIDCGNSGGTTYFTTAISSLVKGCVVVTGDAQIRRRPIKKLLSAINELGAEAFTTREGVDAAPVIIQGPIQGGICHFDGLLSSYITGILIAAPLTEKGVEILVEDMKEVPYVEMTLDWLRRQGIQAEKSDDNKRLYVPGGQRYAPIDRVIPGDWSSAAFPMIAAVLTGSEYRLDSLDYTDAQGDKAIVELLRKMGAQIDVDAEKECLYIKPCQGLTTDMEINLENIPDTLPALSVVAAAAKGKTVFTGIKNVRLKETDRVAVMCSELTKMGIRTESDADTMTVYGGTLKGAVVDSYDDHRVAMALAAAGMISEGDTTVLNAQCVNISYPGFLKDMLASGANMVIKE